MVFSILILFEVMRRAPKDEVLHFKAFPLHTKQVSGRDILAPPAGKIFCGCAS